MASKPADKKEPPKAPTAQTATANAGDAPVEGTPTGRRKKLVLGAAAAVLLAGGGAAYYFLSSKGPNDGKEGGSAAAATPRKKQPVFVDLDTFTVNLREPDDDRFMQVKLVAEVKDAAAGELLKTMMPAVRNEILLVLGSKQAQDVANRQGKEQLAQEIALAANRPLEGTSAAKAVETVNFTHLIVQ